MSVEKPHDGICKGGPWNGQNYRHWAKSFPIMQPAAVGPVLFRSPMDCAIEPVELGRYRHDGAGSWHWTPARRT